MQLYLRIYTIRPGEMDAWLEEWREHVVPLRQAVGFRVFGAWVSEQTDTFTWLIGYDGPEGFEAANAAYYASPERTAVDPNPGRHIAEARELPVRPVEL
jgi:hypothetical protein